MRWGTVEFLTIELRFCINFPTWPAPPVGQFWPSLKWTKRRKRPKQDTKQTLELIDENLSWDPSNLVAFSIIASISILQSHGFETIWAAFHFHSRSLSSIFESNASAASHLAACKVAVQNLWKSVVRSKPVIGRPFKTPYQQFRQSKDIHLHITWTMRT